MALIKPFRGWRYGSEFNKTLSDVIVPPYDVISPQELSRLKKVSSHNFSHIILSDGEEKHKKAAALFRRWCEEKVFIQEKAPAFYFYKQEFSLKPQELFCQPQIKNSKGLFRTGLFCRVRLEEYGAKIILPHEKTFSGPKADRYQLMAEAQGNMEPVFLGYDSTRFSGDDFEIYESKKPAMSFQDNAGVQHSLWPVTEESILAEIEKALSDNKFFILDGHHRYETALNYYRDNREKDKRASLGYVLADICSFRQPGTVILPTHRALKGLKGINADKIISTLEKLWEVSHNLTLSQVEQVLLTHQGAAFGLKMAGEKGYSTLIKKRSDRSRLDLEILHWEVLPPLAALRGKSFEENEIAYIKDITDLESQIDRNDYQLGFLVRPSTSEEVMRVANAGKVMPHKSTFFFPKIPSGLVVNLFDK